MSIICSKIAGQEKFEHWLINKKTPGRRILGVEENCIGKMCGDEPATKKLYHIFRHNFKLKLSQITK
jgi:hypothetical protein